MTRLPVWSAGRMAVFGLLASLVHFAAPASAQSPATDGRYARGYSGSSVGMQGVSISNTPGGGMTVNIANIGASATMLGRPAWSGNSFAGHGGMSSFPAFPSPGFTWGANNPFGMAGFNVSVGGGSSGSGGLTVNIANIGFTNPFFGAYPRWYSGPNPRSPVDVSSGNGGSDNSSATGGEADSGGVGTGGY